MSWLIILALNILLNTDGLIEANHILTDSSSDGGIKKYEEMAAKELENKIRPRFYRSTTGENGVTCNCECDVLPSSKPPGFDNVNIDVANSMPNESENKSPSGAQTRQYQSYPCPLASDGVPKIACPSVGYAFSTKKCIDEYQLCNRVQECPNGEDEDPRNCLFYSTIKRQLRTFEQALHIRQDYG